MNQENRNEAWDVYLESVQNGLDYVLRVCKCLQLYIVHIEKVCNITPHLTFDVTNFETSKKKRGGGGRV